MSTVQDFAKIIIYMK